MENPTNYLSSNSLQIDGTRQILEEHRSFFQWSKREHILDVGCGPGDVTSTILVPYLPEDSVVIGCDISEEMIEYGNRVYKNERLMFKLLDIQQKNVYDSWKTNSFDKIFSFYCLHWILDLRQALQNIYSLLKSKGVILLLFLTPDNPVTVAMEKLKISKKWKKFIEGIEFYYKSEEPLSLNKAILHETGFEDIKCYLKNNHSRFPSWEAFLCLAKSVNPYLCHIPAELKSEYLQELSDLLAQEKAFLHELSGEVVLKYKVIIALAKKP